MIALPTTSVLLGVNVAAITPRGKTGDINFGAAFELIDYLCAARVGGIAFFTAWGEYPALAVDDRARFTYLAVKRSRVPVLAGVGSATLDHSLDLAREARGAGAAAILLPPPLHYCCDEDDILEFYTQFAAQIGSDLPLFLSGGIMPRTAVRLLESGRYAGVVDDSGAVDYSAERLVLSGDDRLFVRARSSGLGVVSAAACAAPELMMALNSAICAGDGEQTARLQAMHRELLSWLDKFPSPVGVKTAVEVRGIQTGPLPAPLAPGKQQCLEEFREWFRSWLPASRKLTAHG